MKPKLWRPELLGLIVAACASRLWTITTPNAVVFDEVYFKEFAAHYLDGNYFFDIHPPLAKLLFAGLAWLGGLTPEAMLEGTALLLRLLPAVAGILLIPLVWGILRRLGAGRPFAFLGGFLILADNALLVESRFILMDSLLLLCGLGALYWYLIARTYQAGRNRLYWLYFSLAAACAGLAVSIKWTGLSALAIIGLVWLWDQRAQAIAWPRRLIQLTTLVLVPFIIYLAAFWGHFQLLPQSGDGDAFMSPRFQATLIGGPEYDPTTKLTFFEKFVELNGEMYRANQTLTATHPYGSAWYTWPLQQRPVYYWQGDLQADNRQGNIYLLGNPIIWWGIWIALLLGIFTALLRKHKLKPTTVAALAIVGAAYLINLLPFVAVSRVMFLYHYFFSFIFSLMFVVLLWNDLAHSTGNAVTTPRFKRLLSLVIVLIISGFVYFAPLSYGTLLSPEQLQARMWLPSWR